MKDAALLDTMYQQNLEYYKELNLYIAAGKKKIEDVRTKELPEMIKKAETSEFRRIFRRRRPGISVCTF